MGIASTIFGVAVKVAKKLLEGASIAGSALVDISQDMIAGEGLPGSISGEIISDAIESAAVFVAKKFQEWHLRGGFSEDYKAKLKKMLATSKKNVAWYQNVTAQLLEEDNTDDKNLGRDLDKLFRKFVFVTNIYEYICEKSTAFKNLKDEDQEAAEIFAVLIISSYESYVNTLFKKLALSDKEYAVVSVLALLINKQRAENRVFKEEIFAYIGANAGKEVIVSDANGNKLYANYVTLRCDNCGASDMIDYDRERKFYVCRRCESPITQPVTHKEQLDDITTILDNIGKQIEDASKKNSQDHAQQNNKLAKIEKTADEILNLLNKKSCKTGDLKTTPNNEKEEEQNQEEISEIGKSIYKAMSDLDEISASVDKIGTEVKESDGDNGYHVEQEDLINRIKEQKGKLNELEERLKTLQKDSKGQVGSSIWASSLVKSYESNGNQGDIEKSLKAFSERGKQKFVVFISAQRKNKEGQPSLEYKVAKRLAKEFEKRRIGYFWWEDAKKLRIQAYKDGKENGEHSICNEWPISTKIAAGLAFSSVMVALAFDNVTKDGDDKKYQYDSLLDNADSNGFKYEVAQFSAMTNDREKAKEFVEGIVDGKDYESLCPTKRYLKFFTYGEPKSHQIYKNAAGKSIFDNREDIIVPVQGRNVEDLAEKIYNEVLEAMSEDSDIMDLVEKENDNHAGEEPDGSKLKKGNNQRKTRTEIKRKRVKAAFIEKYKGNFNSSVFSAAKNYFLPLKEQISLPGDNDWKGLSPCPTWNENDPKVNYPDEDTESVPSDVFFEYAVIDEEGKSAKNHFTFFPERDGKNWKMKILIKDWNYAFIEEPIRKSQKENGTSQKPVPFPQDSLAGFESVTCAMDGAKETAIALKKETQRDAESDYKNFGGGLLTVATTYAGYEQWKYANGTLCFSKEDSKEERRYYFYIRFLPKRVIKYRIRTFGQHVHFKLETRLRKPISVEVVLGRNSSASRLCERYPEKYQISKSLTIDGGAITNNSLKDMAFGLRPVGRDADYFVLLEDGSIDSLQTIDKKVLRCPYCGRPYPCGGEKVPDEEKNRCYYNFTYPYYKGAQDGEKSKQDENASDSARQGISMLFQQVSQDDVEWISHPGNELKRNVKPMKVPEGIKEGAVISLAGVSGSGKSTFLSALFGMLSGTETYISKIFERYVETSIFVNSATQDTENDMAKQMRQNYYAVELYKGFVERTAHGDLGLNAQIAHVPHTIELSNIQGKDGTAYLSIFDVPGGCLCVPQGRSATDTETYEFKNYSKDYTMLCKSDCIILLVNGEAGNGASDAQIDFGSAQGILAELRLKLEESDRNAIALAVVLCKFDMFNTAFDKNSYVRSSPPVSADGKNESQQKFGGSQLHKYIEGCSREVKAFIEEKHGVGLIQEVNCFKHHMYFTVSSTGRSDIIAVKGGEKYMIYRSQPNNVDNVLLWLMYQTGIIR